MFFNKRETPVYTRVFHRKHSYGIISLYSLPDSYFFFHNLSSKLLNLIWDPENEQLLYQEF